MKYSYMHLLSNKADNNCYIDTYQKISNWLKLKQPSRHQKFIISKHYDLLLIQLKNMIIKLPST